MIVYRIQRKLIVMIIRRREIQEPLSDLTVSPFTQPKLPNHSFLDPTIPAYHSQTNPKFVIISIQVIVC